MGARPRRHSCSFLGPAGLHAKGSLSSTSSGSVYAPGRFLPIVPILQVEKLRHGAFKQAAKVPELAIKIKGCR